MTATGYVLSDLHLFADRSSFDLYSEQIVEISHQADFIVLNGDIFDYRWSRFLTTAETTKAALNWLDQLTSRNAKCQIYYVMGNHDGLASFAKALESGFKRENFHWSPTHFRIGTALFLHGDLPLAGKNPFERPLIHDEPPRNERMNKLYTQAVRMKLHRVADVVNHKRKSVKAIYKSLQLFPHKDSEGVKDIYFGHTHVSFEDCLYMGYVFHNTGGAIKGVRKKILAVKAHA